MGGYFKGWYFKCSNDEKNIAFIPAFHLDGKKKTASLQVITDDEALNIPFDSLKYTEKPLFVTMGDCNFSERGIRLNVKTDKSVIEGELHFGRMLPIKYDIMGPFKYVPFMQCRHSVFSMLHRISGRIFVNGKPMDFNNGVGYIEGDCGISFPKRYIWTQCCFENGSIMLSVADIPFLGFGFIGIIGVVLLGSKEYRIATYLGAVIKEIGENTVTVKQRDLEFTAKLVEKNAHPLLAPISGRMDRTIHESASCKAYYRLSKKGKILCEFTSERASFEFEY